MKKASQTQTTKNRMTGRSLPSGARPEAERRERVKREQGSGKVLVGRVLSMIALIFCVPAGILFVSVAIGAVGLVLGIVGYTLGARRLGSVAVVLCTAAMFLGLLVGQGAIPGSYDVMLDGVKEAIQEPFSN